MANLSANISWLFTEVALSERFAAAAASGFRAVELLDPYELPAAEIAAALRANGLQLALINAPMGDRACGERGFAARPGDEDRFRAGLELALAYAAACDCSRVHVLSGQLLDRHSLHEHEATLARNLQFAADRCIGAGVTLTIEPLNARDNPGYVLASTAQALRVIERAGRSNVGLQLDVYHTHISEGDVQARIDALRGRFAHVQIAGFPGRNEPAGGAIDGAAVLAQLDAQGYDGWIGLEYAPRTTTRDGLAWAAAHLRRDARA